MEEIEEIEEPPEGLQQSPEDAFRFLQLNRYGYDFCHSEAQAMIEELAGMVPKSKGKERKRILSKLQRYNADAKEIVSRICKYTQATYLGEHLSSETFTQLDAEVQEEFKVVVQNRDDGSNDEDSDEESSLASLKKKKKGTTKGRSRKASNQKDQVCG